MRFPIIPILLIALPLAEIAVFILVGQYIGILPVLALIFLTAAAGSILLRVQGLAVLRRLAEETEAGRTPARELVHGGMIVLAGLFLLTPGFVTDTIGLLLFIPAVRDFVWSRIKNRISFTFVGGMRGGASSSGYRDDRDGPVVDLDEDDFHREPDKSSPWNKRLDG